MDTRDIAARNRWLAGAPGVWRPLETALQDFRRARAVAAVRLGSAVELDTKGTLAIPDGTDAPIEARCFAELRAVLDLLPVNPRLSERLARYLMRDDVRLLLESGDPLLVEQGTALADHVSPAAIADVMLVDPSRAMALLRYLSDGEVLALLRSGHPVVELYGVTLVARLPPDVITELAAGPDPVLRAVAAEAVRRALSGE